MLKGEKFLTPAVAGRLSAQRKLFFGLQSAQVGAEEIK
jgi:hypothetical protein